MMSPARRRDAAWLMAAAEPMPPCATALTIASDEMPTMPTVLTSPLNSPRTAVPWFVQSTPGDRRPADHAALVLRQVFVGEAPVALDVDDADVAAAAARLRPRPARIDAARRGVEIDLSGREVGGGRRRIGFRRRHIVHANFDMDARGGRGFARRLDVGGLHRVVFEEFLGKRIKTLVGRVDMKEKMRPGIGLRYALCGVSLQALFVAKQRRHPGAVGIENGLQGVDVEAGDRCDTRIPCAQPGMFMCDDDEFARASRRMAWRPPTTSASTAGADSHVLISR